MNPLESLSMATRTLAANKMRSFLTMLGITIGNAATIATIGVGDGAQNFVASEIEALGPNILFVRGGSPEADRRPVLPPQTLVLADATAIASQVPTVDAVAPELTASELVSRQGNNMSATIVGTVPDYTHVRDFDVQRGRFITSLDVDRLQRVAVLGSSLGEQLFGRQDPIGRTIRVRNLSFRVIGIMEPKGSSFGMDMDTTLLVPLTTLSDRLVGRTSPYGIGVTYIAVRAKDETVMKAAQFQIENLLRLRHKIEDEDDFTVRNQKDLLQTFANITGTLKVGLAAIASISLVVGGIGIMNIMLVSVTERTGEIGLRKALGATPRDILAQFTIEATILAILGGAIGTGLGTAGIALVRVGFGFDAAVSTSAIVFTTSISGAIGLGFGVIPARQAARLDPIVALRSA